MPIRNSWTKEELDLLFELKDEGKNYTEISEEFKRRSSFDSNFHVKSHDAIEQKWHRVRLTKRKDHYHLNKLKLMAVKLQEAE